MRRSVRQDPNHRLRRDAKGPGHVPLTYAHPVNGLEHQRVSSIKGFAELGPQLLDITLCFGEPADRIVCVRREPQRL